MNDVNREPKLFYRFILSQVKTWMSLRVHTRSERIHEHTHTEKPTEDGQREEQSLYEG